MGKSVRIAALLLAIATADAGAFDEGVEAGLSGERVRIDFDTGVETRTSRLSLFLSENVRPWLSFALHGGPLLLTQSGNPATRGLELSGYHLGVSARAEAFQHSAVGVVGSLHYSYQRADAREDDREVTITLHEARGELGALLRLQSLQLQLGSYALYLDGDETVSGPTPGSAQLEADEQFGGFVQADFLPDPTGTVSLRLDTGAREAITLRFARRF
jgi:hypothetical protein